MTIEKIKIDDINGQEFVWELQPDVNILCCENESGKSRLMKKIYTNIFNIKNSFGDLDRIPSDECEEGFYVQFSDCNHWYPELKYLTLDVSIMELINRKSGIHIPKSSTVLDLMITKTYEDLHDIFKLDTTIKQYMYDYFNIENGDWYYGCLSANEKILYFILLNVISTRNKDTILILDGITDPLQPEWKKTLLNVIRIINEHVQILTT